MGTSARSVDDGQFYEDLDVAMVLGARAGLIMRRALRAAGGRVDKRPVGSFRPGRRPSRHRDFDLGAHLIMREYFGVGEEPPVYSEQDFDKRHRMPRLVLKRLYVAVRDEPWWRRGADATGRLKPNPEAGCGAKSAGVWRAARPPS